MSCLGVVELKETGAHTTSLTVTDRRNRGSGDSKSVSQSWGPGDGPLGRPASCSKWQCSSSPQAVTGGNAQLLGW